MKTKETKCAFCTQKEVAAHFSVGAATVRRWHGLGCPRVYVTERKAGTGSRPRYDLAAVRAWLETRTQKGGES